MKVKVNEIVGLIKIREHLSKSINDLTQKMSREELKAIQAKITVLDKIIIQGSINIDLSAYSEFLV